ASPAPAGQLALTGARKLALALQGRSVGAASASREHELAFAPGAARVQRPRVDPREAGVGREPDGQRGRREGGCAVETGQAGRGGAEGAVGLRRKVDPGVTDAVGALPVA